MDESVHTPVLRRAARELLAVRPGGRYVDATVNGGGHAADILDASAPDGIVLGIDRDAAILESARTRLGGAVAAGRLRLVHGSFRDLQRHLAAAPSTSTAAAAASPSPPTSLSTCASIPTATTKTPRRSSPAPTQTS
jgi:16S rRNA C1402 N4-methylase RsmH